MKILIVGGVAGGASAATRLRRLDERAEIILFEKGPYVSYANCGLPYYIGGVIAEKEKLLVTKPELLRRPVLHRCAHRKRGDGHRQGGEKGDGTGSPHKSYLRGEL